MKIVFTTCNSGDKARQMGRVLVQEKLSACVQIVPRIMSIYHWKEAVCTDEEWLLIIKTGGEKLARLKERIADLHTYAIHEVVILDGEIGSPEYAKWFNGVLTNK